MIFMFDSTRITCALTMPWGGVGKGMDVLTLCSSPSVCPGVCRNSLKHSEHLQGYDENDQRPCSFFFF